MKKLILGLLLVIGAVASSQAQCDKRVIIVSSVTEHIKAGEVEKTKELQVAFLTGVMCCCTFVMTIFYAPRLYELFLVMQKSFA